MADIINAEKPEIVISTGSNELIDLTRVHSIHAPIVQQLHIYPSTLLKNRQYRRNSYIRAAFSQVAAIQVLLPSHVAVLRETLGKALPSKTPIVVIGNTSAFTVSNKAITQKPIILYPAALTPGKRQDFLIEAFAHVANSHPAWQLHLYGTGNAAYSKKIAQLIAKRHLEKRVILKGWCPDLTEAYASCSFVAFPSAMEGFGLVILDAALFGKPTVCCKNTPSVSELVHDHETGFLTENTPKAFAAALRTLMDNSSYCIQLGSNARDFYYASYTPDIILKQWEELLSSVTNKA